MTDAELVRQTRSGQTSAYEVLVRRWSARLIGYVRARVGTQEVAEDIAQDSLLKAFRRLESLGDPEKFGSWLLCIAHRASQDWLKAKTRSEVLVGDMQNGTATRLSGRWESTDEQPAEFCIRKEREASVAEGINGLPEALRETLLMYYYQEGTYAELAEILGVSTATINARLTKARNMLRQQLSDARREP